VHTTKFRSPLRNIYVLVSGKPLLRIDLVIWGTDGGLRETERIEKQAKFSLPFRSFGPIEGTVCTVRNLIEVFTYELLVQTTKAVTDIND